MAKTVRRRKKDVLTDIEAQQESETRKRNLITYGAIALGVIALFTLLFLSLREPPALEGLVDFGTMERGHDDNVVYANTDLPPAGGIHANIWQNCGIYSNPIESRYAVHSLEHGAVWIAYQPDLPESQIEELERFARGDGFTLLAPFPGLRSPVVVTSWSYQLEVDDAGDDRIGLFIERNKNGTRTPEPGATCRDGNGTPDGL
jgi:hypothetical protein